MNINFCLIGKQGCLIIGAQNHTLKYDDFQEILFLYLVEKNLLRIIHKGFHRPALGKAQQIPSARGSKSAGGIGASLTLSPDSLTGSQGWPDAHQDFLPGKPGISALIQAIRAPPDGGLPLLLPARTCELHPSQQLR